MLDRRFDKLAGLKILDQLKIIGKKLPVNFTNGRYPSAPSQPIRPKPSPDSQPEAPLDPDPNPPRKTPAAGALAVPVIPEEEREPLNAYSKERVA